MYNITLEINQKCNLRCKYCYLGEKKGNRMPVDVGYRALDIAFDETRKHRDRKLSVQFIGGEPLLDFELMKDLVEYCEEKNKEYKYLIAYSITTNATVLSAEIADFLCNYGFMIKISIDGDKAVNDINRVASSGEGAFDKVMEKLPLFKDIQDRGKYLIQVTNVITGNNYMHYFETLKYLTRNLGLKAIDTAVDVSYDWNEEQIKVLENNVRQSFDYFVESYRAGRRFEWSLFQLLLNMEMERKKFFFCGAGIISMYVRTDGTLLPCSGCLDEVVAIGNVISGIDKAKVNFYKKIDSIDNDECNKCEIYDYCGEKSCMMQNLEVNKDMNKPVHVMCAKRKFLYKLYVENLEIIKEIAEEMVASRDLYDDEIHRVHKEVFA